MNQHSVIAIVPAAGVGSRASSADGLPKQYRRIAGQPMLRRTVQALLVDPRVVQVRVAVSALDTWASEALAGLPRTLWRACGGPTRADTVRAALREADLPPAAWVMVHDAARPGLPRDALARLIDTCQQQNRGGLLALPVADTVKCAHRPRIQQDATVASRAPDDTHRPHGAASDAAPDIYDVPVAARGGAQDEAIWTVERTLAREGLWLAQTPQMFRAGELLAALVAGIGDPRVTDEASAIELAGHLQAPLLIRGARANDKLTWSEDFEWFEGMHD